MVSQFLITALSLALVFETALLAQTGTNETLGATKAPASANPRSNTVTPEVRGDIFMARKMYREAVEAYKEGSSNSAVLLNKMGIAYHQMQDLRAAEKHYKQAVKVNKNYAEAINNLGTVYYARKSYRQAINQYKKALRVNPQSASFYSNLGVGYFARKDYKRAAEAWQQALAIDPEVFEARGNAGGVSVQERSISAEDRAKFHYSLAQTYAKKGMNDRALLYIRKALEEGYKERKKIGDDPAFESLKELAEFKELLAMEPRVL
jgi:tetratricopeptide (TPR) repeat protein